ncbi:hypothetical protein [Nonomuraea sediminis]|uniref:hypothetical protein n=1 Tax=Nonomuraea sediminis TaxID=2835864 RepID=UPI001BDCC030|nr:hypothetical protein [Nonomuraea sediminis]
MKGDKGEPGPSDSPEPGQIDAANVSSDAPALVWWLAWTAAAVAVAVAVGIAIKRRRRRVAQADSGTAVSEADSSTAIGDTQQL